MPDLTAPASILRSRIGRSSPGAICIVGAGPAGLVAAKHLRESGVDGEQIVLLDQGARGTFGRALTARSAAGFARELGAGRFSIVRHAEVLALLRAYEIPTQPFRYTRLHSSAIDQDLLARLRVTIETLAALPGARSDSSRSLRAALDSTLSDDQKRNLCEWSGYGSLIADTFPLAGALDVLLTHPESFACRTADDEWEAPTAGFAELGETLASELTAAGATLIRNISVQAIAPADRYTVFAEHALEGPIELSAAGVIVATQPASVARMRHPWPALTEWAASQSAVPLFKCFADVETPWWDSRLDARIVTGVAPLQKLYFDAARRTVFWYCDSASALRFKDIVGRPDQVLGLAEDAIAAGLSLPRDQVRLGPEAHLQFWSQGITYPGVGVVVPDGDALDLAPGASYASDGLTDHIGWIEGAIRSGRVAADRIMRTVMRPRRRRAV